MSDLPAPSLIRRDDGTVSMVWPDGLLSTPVTYEVLVEMVEAHNRSIALAHQVERLVARLTRWRTVAVVLADELDDCYSRVAPGDTRSTPALDAFHALLTEES